MVAGWIDRLRGLTGARSERDAPSEAATALDDLRDTIRRDVFGGFLDEDVILRNAVEIYEKQIVADTLRPQAQRFLREALQRHREATRGWPDETDCDRLDAAFAALEADGVVCRQNFSCCGACGAGEIHDEIAAAQADGQAVRGYAFYHMQDTDAAVDGDGLYLNYGGLSDGEEDAVAVGRDVATAIAAQGLHVEWNGRWSDRIAVAIDWKRRR